MFNLRRNILKINKHLLKRCSAVVMIILIAYFASEAYFNISSKAAIATGL